MQMVTLLKNDFKKEESRNIDREIALEKWMLTKPQFFYDHTTKQALGFQNPFYLKKAQHLEPKLYVGDIIEKTNPIVIPDSKETLMLAEESRLKMFLKQKDPIMLEKKVNTTPVDYVNLLFLVDPPMLRYAKLVQELLTNISKTCPSVNNTDEKLVVVTPKNKDKRVRFTEPVTSSGNTITKTTSTLNLVSNKPMLSSTRIKPSTSASGSQPSGNTKKDKIRQTPSS
ncbi:hypothetical protein Tco_0100871, partial [Tanacetum coccineum]